MMDRAIEGSNEVEELPATVVGDEGDNKLGQEH